MRARVLVVVLIVLGLVTVLTSCKKPQPIGEVTPPESSTAAPPTAPQEEVTYAIIPKMLNNPVFTLAQRGAEAAAAELGPHVKIIYESSETGKPAEQAEVIRGLAAKGVDGMSISVIDANAVREPINEAVDKGINVICFDSDCPDSKRITFYAVSDEAVGQELANQLIAACGGKEQMTGEVAIMSGQSSAPNLQVRVAGAKSVLNSQDFPNLKILPVLYCDDKGEKGIEQIRTTMESHPDLRGWIMVGGWPLFFDGALDSVKDPDRTKVVAVDALPKQWDYVEAGQVQCLVAQRCFAWGSESVHILENLRTGAKTYPDFVASGYDLVFKAPTAAQRDDAKQRGLGCYSVAEYKEQWDKWNAKPETASQ